jgi:hypothetical protein
LNFESYIKGRIVQYVTKEALDVGFEAMCGVAQVLANRVQEGWGDWNVVLDKADDVVGALRLGEPIDPRDSTFRRMLTAVDDIYHGVANDDAVNLINPFDHAKQVSLYYCDPLNCTNLWFRVNILNDEPSHQRLASIGPLIFFA